MEWIAWSFISWCMVAIIIVSFILAVRENNRNNEVQEIPPKKNSLRDRG